MEVNSYICIKNFMNPVYNTLREALCRRYDEREARAIAFLVLEEAFGVSRTDVYADKVRHFSAEESDALQNISQRLAAGEPVQYVLGRADFCGMSLRVTAATLIPRPETAELVGLCAALPGLPRTAGGALRVLDGGTGSGCIAIALARRLEGARIEAWDVSEEALRVARLNAEEQGVTIDFRCADLLQPPPSEPFSLIVSNPPYVTESEREGMEEHVLRHEPAGALFVPDSDPLRFYRALAALAADRLLPGGMLAVEINRAYGREVAEAFERAGLKKAVVRRDDFGNDRFVLAEK